jgi:hypothetical protein
MASSLTISASIAAMLEDCIEPTPGVSIGVWFDQRDEWSQEPLPSFAHCQPHPLYRHPDGSPTLLRLFTVFKLDAADLASTAPWGRRDDDRAENGFTHKSGSSIRNSERDDSGTN